VRDISTVIARPRHRKSKSISGAVRQRGCSMNIVRDPDVLFVLMWLAGCIITAGLVETIKAGMTKPYKWLWRVLAGGFLPHHPAVCLVRGGRTFR